MARYRSVMSDNDTDIIWYHIDNSQANLLVTHLSESETLPTYSRGRCVS